MDYDPDPVLLPGLLEVYGKRWQIGRDDETSVWIAVQRPTPTAVHVMAAFSLHDLASKLAAEEGQEDMLAASLDDILAGPDPGEPGTTP